MRIARRVALGLVVVVVVLGAVAAWQAYRLKQDLTAAESAVDRLDLTLRGDDVNARNQAASEFTDHAASAASRTDGLVWGFVEKTPVLGDDAPDVSGSQVAPGGPVAPSGSAAVQRSASEEPVRSVSASRPRRLGLGEPISPVLQRSAEPAAVQESSPADSGAAVAPLAGAGVPAVQRAVDSDVPGTPPASGTVSESSVQRLADAPRSPGLGMPVVRQASEPTVAPSGTTGEPAAIAGFAEQLPVLALRKQLFFNFGTQVADLRYSEQHCQQIFFALLPQPLCRA